MSPCSHGCMTMFYNAPNYLCIVDLELMSAVERGEVCPGRIQEAAWRLKQVKHRHIDWLPD